MCLPFCLCSTEKALNYFSSHSTAVTCIKHLLSAHTVLGKSTVMCQIDMDIIKPWLNQIDNGEVSSQFDGNEN